MRENSVIISHFAMKRLTSARVENVLIRKANQGLLIIRVNPISRPWVAFLISTFSTRADVNRFGLTQGLLIIPRVSAARSRPQVPQDQRRV